MNNQSTLLATLRNTYFSDKSIVIYGALTILLCIVSFLQLPVSEVLTLFVTGWIIYLPEEYLSHVLVFHGPLFKNKHMYRLMYRLHLGHHDKPRRIDLLFTPLWYTLPALLLNVVIFSIVTNDAYQIAALTSGLIFGYLLFEWWHLIVHSPYQLNSVLRYVRNQHMGHHHWNERRWFTISPPALILDFFFRTGGKIQKAPRSSNPMTSGLNNSDERLVNARRYYREFSDWKEDESALWKI